MTVRFRKDAAFTKVLIEAGADVNIGRKDDGKKPKDYLFYSLRDTRPYFEGYGEIGDMLKKASKK